jgi:RNA-binding protein
METLKGYQKKFLKGLAHGLKPVVFIGQKGLSGEKQQKTGMAEAIEAETGCRLVGIIGHTAIFYRRHTDPEKRKIQLPHR